LTRAESRRDVYLAPRLSATGRGARSSYQVQRGYYWRH
jgi:hypothetical protein